MHKIGEILKSNNSEILKQYKFLNKGIYMSFIGPSGSGKSTLLNYISENYDIKTKEVSARKFLDSTKGSYDEQMNDELQTKINFHYIKETFENIIKIYEGKSIITTRCLIDSLAYTYTLKAAEFLIPQMEEAVEFLKERILNNEMIILYTPCDFPMAQIDDKIRGMNEDIRQKTDKVFIDILGRFNIPHFTIKGTIEERKSILDEIMKKYNIQKLLNN